MKKIFHDIIPQGKRSIRNIPLTKKDEQSESRDTYVANSIDATISNATISNTKSYTKTSHNMDGIRPKYPSISTPSITTSQKSDSTKDSLASKYSEVSIPDTDEDEEEYERDEDILKPIFKKETSNKKIEVEPAFFEGSSKDFEDDSDADSNFEEWNKHQKKSYVRATIVLVLFIGLVFFLLSTYFGGATISINPVRHDIVLKETKIALNTISHETVTVELNDSDEVSSNGTVKVDRKAVGKVILYNAFNSSTQKLVADTRLETPNGLIYKLKSATSIPGQKTVNGKPVPGSVEVEVEASEAGEKYNQGFRDFKVVAYKGSDRYEGIYGRSKTALSNGFLGTVPNIATKDIASSTSRIKEEINAKADELFRDKAKDKGENYVYIPSTKKVTFKETRNEISKDGKSATLKIEATATAVLLDSTTLFAEIIKNQSEQIGEQIEGDTNFDSTKEIVYTGDFSKLNISLDGETSLQVTGTTSISSAIETVKVTRAVSGLSKEQAIGAIKRLVELETIEIDIKPWWKKKLPSADKIKIETEQ